MEWVKAFHVISVIAWMAGLFYLPRLFVYHADAEIGSKQSETFKVMERRLLRAITTPAMIAAWIFGLWMVIGFQAVSFAEGWVWVKAVLVIAMSGYHGLLVRHTKAFAEDRNDKPARYFRMINEIPTLLMIGIVIAVIVRPF
ncbi:membrane protein [Devosia geojensis]|uniref:Protoporphyrinogen IX oxidase n=1 Tax=Devosia geojensis TaxID=443610 RepID=A0A0F5FI19_9HYPH|nr:protoporphyrinogen oxidase HemJ [Devosia geojensis]KKB08453.1 membrane protein [Devosia geojensis]